VSQKQRTIARPISVAGIGLHTGVKSTLTFQPAEPGSGVAFVRTDLEGKPVIPADITHTRDIGNPGRRTSLGRGEATVTTVEHVLAAVAGLAIDNIRIEVNAEEPAEPDGSSLPFVRALRDAGTVEQDAPREVFRLRESVSFRNNGVELVALPHDGLRISFTLEYNHPLVGTQFACFDISEETFEKEVSPARTFSLNSELDALRAAGLIKGGTLKNAVVVGEDGVLNDEPLRFPNEFVRHKILDLVGDLHLLGRPLQAHVIAVRSGHASNVGLVRRIHQVMVKDREHGKRRFLSGNIPSQWDINDIQEIMPHRYPFLLVDRIVELVERERVVGIKNVTINEPFFQGHFPGHPIMPAVLIVEAMAQTGGVLLLSAIEERENKLVYFMGIDNARFRKPVLPGDTLRFELELLKMRSKVCKMRGRAYVEGDLVAEADLTSTVVER